MGQLIAVTEKPSTNRGVVRFETNRALTGMGHERYRLGDDIFGVRPPDELARRLLAHGGVDGVHVNGNIITIDLTKGHTADGLKEIVENLYSYYDEEKTAEFLAAEAAKAKAAAEAEAAEAAKAEAAKEAEAAAKAEEEAKAVQAAEGEEVVEETPAMEDSSVPDDPAGDATAEATDAAEEPADAPAEPTEG